MLLANPDLLNKIVGVFPTAALVLEGDTVRSANEPAAALLGCTSDEMRGQKLSSLTEASGRKLELVTKPLDASVALVTLTDRTELFEAERALREEEDRLAQVLRCAPGVVFSLRMRTDGTSSIPFASIGIEAMFGVSREAIAVDATPLGDAIFPEDRAALRANLLEAGESFSTFTADFRVFVNGDTRTIEVRMSPMREPDGTLVFHGFATDLTHELRAHNELREAETRFTQAFQLSPIGLTLTSLVDFRVLEVNEAYLRMWNRRREDVVDKPSDSLPAQMPDATRRRLEELVMTHQEVRDLEYPFVRDDGTEGYARVSVAVIERQGSPYALMMIDDITERRRAEAERRGLEEHLRQSQKLESIGRLAGGVAHDFNNWLTVLSGCLEELGEHTPATDAEANELLSETRNALERAASLTRDLLAFSRQEILDPKVVDLNDVVSDGARMLRRLLGEDIELAVELDRTARHVRIDRNHWASVLLNLSVAARDALPDGGKISIRTRAGRGEGDDGFVFLEIADDGPGLEPDAVARIFEPFFSSKGKQGTGLGLAVVHGIVVQSGGTISVASAPGQGTTFVIRLPVAGGDESRASHGPKEKLRGNGTILLAEDEDMVRRLTGRALRANGFEVLEAANGADALAALERAPHVDLLLTDLIMPGMTGRELAEEAVRRCPSIALLYTTGYTQDAVARTGIRRAEVAFLQKPFTTSSLLNAVQQAIEGKRRAVSA